MLIKEISQQWLAALYGKRTCCLGKVSKKQKCFSALCIFPGTGLGLLGLSSVEQPAVVLCLLCDIGCCENSPQNASGSVQWELCCC